MIEGLPSLAACAKLITLDLSGCDSLLSLPPLDGCIALETLELSRCRALPALPPLATCAALRTLGLAQCTSLTRVPPLRECAALRSLVLDGCGSLEALPGLDGCARELALEVRGIPPKLVAWEANDRRPYDLASGEGVVSATCVTINLQDTRLEALPAWLVSAVAAGELPCLKVLDLRFCRLLKALPDLSGAKALRSVVVIGCTALATLPDPTVGLWITYEWKARKLSSQEGHAARGRYGVPKRLQDWSDQRYRAVQAYYEDRDESTDDEQVSEDSHEA
jgi:hypothetical protein